ncbi:MAG: hypothetical protein MJA83_07035, partial [Gammaproteobacteria bacterium]|nr:hypothetical protein [Gammaproteobacteria bacterium]
MPAEVVKALEVAAMPVKRHKVSDNPSKEEVAAIRKNLLKEYVDVFDETALKPMKGDPVRVELKEGAVPFAVHTPRPIPLALRD